MQALPVMNSVFEMMRTLVAERRDNGEDEYAVFIPCAVYADKLHAIEVEARDPKTDRDAAKRALWFVKWSQEAIRRYREFAAFETPREW